MKVIILLLITLGSGSVFSIHGDYEQLPSAARQIIRRDFPSWKLVKVPKEIVEYYAEHRLRERPNLISGDWNGDRRTDFAVLLQKNSNIDKRIILVLIATRNGFRRFVFEGNDCIMSRKKGAQDYDYATRSKFKYTNDAIFSYIWEKAGSSYVWTGKAFRQVTTSD